MGVLWTLGKLLIGYEVGMAIKGFIERRSYYEMAREYCDTVGKPLLTIGMSRFPLSHPNGDYIVDIDPAVEEIVGGIWADEREMPFTNKQFGVCFNSHTLEHLSSPQDVQDAVNECVRVADKAVFLVPSPYSLYNNLLCPHHNLRLQFDTVNNKIGVIENAYKTGVGFQVADTSHPPPHGIGQVMVSEETAPQITSFSGGFIIV